MPFVAPAGAPRRIGRDRALRRRVRAAATTACLALTALLALPTGSAAAADIGAAGIGATDTGAADITAAEAGAAATDTAGTDAPANVASVPGPAPAVGATSACPVSSRYETKIVDGSSQVFRIGAHDGHYFSEQIGGVAGIRYDAIALDPTTDRIHAIADIDAGTSPTDSRGTHVGAGDLLVVDRETGSLTTLGRPGGLPTQAARAAAFGSDGRLYLVPAGDSGTFIEYTPATGTVVTRGVSPSNTDLGTDLSWAHGYLWGRQGSSGAILRLDPATGVVSSFPAPAGLPVGAATTGVFTLGNGNLGFVDDDGTTTQVDIGPADYPTLRVVSQVPSPTDPGDGAVTCVSAPADLAVSKSGPATVEPNGTVTWTVEVRNVGATPSSGWTMNDVLPAGYSDLAAPDRCSTSGTTISCPGGRLAPGEKRTLTYSATAPATAQCSYNTTTVVGDEADPDGSNDAAQLTTCVNAHPAVEVRVESDPGSGGAVAPGSTVTYSIEASNSGNSPLSDVAVEVDVADLVDDAQVSGESITATRGSAPALGDDTLSWSGALQIGETVVITYEAVVGPAFTGTDRLETTTSAVATDAASSCADAGATDCTTTLVPARPGATATPTPGTEPTSSPSTPPSTSPTPTPTDRATAVPSSSGPDSSPTSATTETPSGPSDSTAGPHVAALPTPASSASASAPADAAALASTGGEPAVNLTLAAVLALVALGAAAALRRRH